MTISLARADQILDTLVGTGALTIGLSTTAPAADGSNITEPAGGGYARATATGSTSFTSATAGSKTNGVVIAFPTATGSWGTPSYWFMMDGGGYFIFSGTITNPAPIASGAEPNFAPGALVLTQT